MAVNVQIGRTYACDMGIYFGLFPAGLYSLRVGAVALTRFAEYFRTFGTAKTGSEILALGREAFAAEFNRLVVRSKPSNLRFLRLRKQESSLLGSLRLSA